MTNREYLETLTEEEREAFKKEFIEMNDEAVYEDYLDEDYEEDEEEEEESAEN